MTGSQARWLHRLAKPRRPHAARPRLAGHGPPAGVPLATAGAAGGVCGTSQFVMVWQQQAGTWKITRVVSYDH